MIRFLSNIFIKKTDSVEKQRTAYGMLCGIVGICFNILLFAGKLLAGLIGNSVSIMADAFNNLSDAGSSVITLVGFKLSAQKPDADHPYGHGRLEYISGLIISAIIIVMGFELGKESVGKIIHPEATECSVLTVAILVVSILVKCYMAYYNTSVGKLINSAPLRATAMDSLSDCIATSIVLITTIVSYYTGLQLDGWAGLLVSAFILYAGYSAGRESINPLLGQPPEQEFIDHIEEIVLTFDENIVGVHDLMVHDYGPGRRIISLHAEVPADGNILELHDIIDNLEHRLARELGCVATIHMDPVDTKDERVAQLKETVKDCVQQVDANISIHDFRVVFGETHTNLIFDMAVPFSCDMTDGQVSIAVRKLIKEKIGQNYFAVIKVDRDNYVH